MFSASRLYDLQERDRAISARYASLEDVRARLADESALVSAREELSRLDARLADRAPVRRTIEVAVQQIQARLRAVEGRLYGGAVTNPRELSALEEEKEFHQKSQSAEEDVLLELMVEIEDLQAARIDALDHLTRLEDQRPVERASLVEQEARLVGELTELREARAQIAPQISAAVMSVYDSLRGSRDGVAVAKVERSMCQGCRLALTTSELQKARNSQEMVRCDSCHRILYVL